MKVQLDSNTIVYDGEHKYGPGGVHDIRDAVAQGLLQAGSATPVHEGGDASAPVTPTA